MFGSVNQEVLDHLDFALNAVQSERGHDLEPVHNDARLVKAEEAIKTAIAALNAYQQQQIAR